ncbi:uncharacterized protein G2W53_003669 [Senna tora]|uniref:Uncharacterized protein n=1 Tax=Senna tora TaxID=362788 RepID=A0A834XAD7_9FABA|nr:uncharacterized protein G2W53_003669 [Senna tora]
MGMGFHSHIWLAIKNEIHIPNHQIDVDFYSHSHVWGFHGVTVENDNFAPRLNSVRAECPKWVFSTGLLPIASRQLAIATDLLAIASRRSFLFVLLAIMSKLAEGARKCFN